jgi:DNA mismatch endonuclease (patch repair protein)
MIPPHPGSTSAAASAVARANRKTDTKPEREIRSMLHRCGYRFRKNFPIVLLGRRAIRPDIVFTKAKVAVFIDGCFWHCCPDHGTQPRANTAYWRAKLGRNVERDRENTMALASQGWEVVRVWEHVPVAMAVAEIIQRVLIARVGK